MKKFIFIALLFVPLLCRADFDLAKWKYYKDVLVTGNGLTKVALDDQILAGAKPDLSDLRMVSAQGKETPFKIMLGKDETGTINRPVAIVNNYLSPDKFSVAVMDLGVSGTITNNLTIITPSENFQRNVAVYGSDDAVNWNLLKKDAYIFDYTDRKGNFKSQNTRVVFPDSTFRYLKVEISNDNDPQVQISRVNVEYDTQTKGPEYPRSPRFNVSTNSQNKSSELLVDFENRGLPIDRFLISTGNINFNRDVYIYSSNDKNNWTLLGRSHIFRYQTAKFTGENLQLDFAEANTRYYKIEIVNLDDEPINISKVTSFARYREIAFDKQGDGYRLYYGNRSAGQPEYDLEKYFQYLDLNAASIASLSTQQDNKAYVPEKAPEKTVSEKYPYLLTSGLVLASLIILFMVYKFLKK